MSSNKRRKLTVPSEAPRISAFAARKGLAVGNGPSNIQSLRKEYLDIDAINPLSGSNSLLPVSSAGSVFCDHHMTPPITKESDIRNATSNIHDGTSDVDEDDRLSVAHSRALSPATRLDKPPIPLSTFKPSKDNIQELEDGTLILKLGPGERLVILGQYEIFVQKGQITLFGANLKASSTLYRVYASSSHSLPVIRCLATHTDEAEIRFHQCKAGLDVLNSLSPLFGKLWNDASGPLGAEYKNIIRNHNFSTFQILFSSIEAPKKAYLDPIISPPEWNEILAKVSDSCGQQVSVIMICGPKSSGKSTFAKLLTNRILTTPSGSVSPRSSSTGKSSGVALLDLDPGQPEYSPPGQLSLIHLQEPNFGPPYSHPIPYNETKLIRAHTIGAVTPSSNPDLYMACVVDLFAHYRNMLSANPNLPLVINTPGWVFGTGLEILMDLITQVRPTEVIYLSQDGPAEVMESLKDAAKTTPLFAIPSQISNYTTRTAAHLRTMQSMSYFHLDPEGRNTLAWNDTPLSSIPPWEIRYSGKSPGILGIMCYGEPPPADLLIDLINGSLVAVVVIDDMAAIQGWPADGEDENGEDEEVESVDTKYNKDSSSDEGAFSHHSRHLAKPIIIQTPHETLPYFNPANATYLDPKHSHTLGLALIRGIDVGRRRLQVITPIEASVIDDIDSAGKSIVLVSGKLDTPRWAYTEELIQKTAFAKDAKKQSRHLSDIDDWSDEDEGSGDQEEGDGESNGNTVPGEEFQNTPWIERLEGSQGRGVGARVWRVRRDLGRTQDADE